MNLINKHLDKNNLHHAYLIEGEKDKIVPEIFSFCESLNIKTSGNPDFCHITVDNFKMEEALDLRVMGNEKSFSPGKKIFIVSSNSFTLDAQGTLLKMFEEPIENTHFFLVVPDVNSLLKTLVSRFYLISVRACLAEEIKNAEEFISMSLPIRIDFIKKMLAKPEEEEETSLSSSKALKFLNALEFSLHQKFVSKVSFDIELFSQIFKVREFLRMPGSSAKTLIESVALVIPNFDFK